MKTRIISITALLTALLLTSCFQAETTIHLKKDGSGTIIEETRLGKQMLAMPVEELKGMLVQAEEVAKQRAAKLGEGVAFVKFEKISQGSSKGWRSSYQFMDINKLRISNQVEMESGPEQSQEIKTENLIAFQYSNGALKIRPNMDQKEEAKQPAGGAEMPAEAVAQMKAMLGELKFGIKLVADSGIAETNASHRVGNAITLLELDMGKIMAKQENMKKLGGVGEENKSAALQALNGVDGLKMEAKPEVIVKLK